MDTPTFSTDATRWQVLRRRWPSVLGLAAAIALLATGAGPDVVAIVVVVATLCYLGAAALGRPWVAWAAILGGGVVIAASLLAGVAWWAGLGVAALALCVAGLARHGSHRALTAQAVALLGYGGLAVVALYLAPRLGLALAGVALAGHALWDLHHYRRDQVVPRSLAEACMLLDLPLGAGVVILAIVN